jgi:hypothetical protein
VLSFAKQKPNVSTSIEEIIGFVINYVLIRVLLNHEFPLNITLASLYGFILIEVEKTYVCVNI